MLYATFQIPFQASVFESPKMRWTMYTQERRLDSFSICRLRRTRRKKRGTKLFCTRSEGMEGAPERPEMISKKHVSTSLRPPEGTTFRLGFTMVVHGALTSLVYHWRCIAIRLPRAGSGKLNWHKKTESIEE